MNVAGLRFDVNLSILFTELPLLERPAAAAAAGFDAVELWWPFTSPTPGRDETSALQRALEAAGTALVGLNFAAGDMPGGDRGLLSIPDRAEEFRANIGCAVDFAGRLGCRTLNALYGNRIAGVDPAQQDALAVDNLTRAATAAERIGAVVVLEALNTAENPGYPWTTAEAVLAVLDRVQDSSGVQLGFLCDVYHLFRGGHDAVAALAAYGSRIRHVQIADVPGRHEPGSGEVNFAAVFDALRAQEYGGFVGLEYKPTSTSAQSFGWLAQARGAEGTR